MKDTTRVAIIIVTLTIWILPLLGDSALFAQDPPDNKSDLVYEVGNGVTAPKPIYTPNPEYAERPRKKKIQGTVVLALIVTEEGNVRDVKVTKPVDQDLDKQAVAVVSTWKFKPSTKDGKPVAVHLSVDVSFRLY
ncbi:MAG: energy transducer TonB [Candidatus Sulfotelmatobacter sp.]